MYNLIKAERMFLDPDVGTGGGKNRCTCHMCGEKLPFTSLFELDLGLVCEDCIEENTYTYDVFPEYEDEHYECCVCGSLCEDQVTLIKKDPYCKQCLREAKGYEW